MIVLFDLILNVPSTIFQLNRDGSSWVEPVLSLDKCVLLKDHKAVTLVRLTPAASLSRVKLYRYNGTDISFKCLPADHSHKICLISFDIVAAKFENVVFRSHFKFIKTACQNIRNVVC